MHILSHGHGSDQTPGGTTLCRRKGEDVDERDGSPHSRPRHLPLGNRTSDSDILDIAGRDDRIVVTKDDDFVQPHVVHGCPARRLLIATGNIGKVELEVLCRAHIDVITEAPESARYVELGRRVLTVHA